MKRHAEIAGAGFAGLTAACALAQRGWSVRVHERGQRLRTTGAGIYIYENGLRVLAAVGAYEEAVKGAPFAHTREVRDDRNRVISVHRWEGSRVFSIVRQTVINALAAASTRAGAEIVTGSVATGASADGELVLADGRKLKADLVISSITPSAVNPVGGQPVNFQVEVRNLVGAATRRELEELRASRDLSRNAELVATRRLVEQLDDPEAGWEAAGQLLRWLAGRPERRREELG